MPLDLIAYLRKIPLFADIGECTLELLARSARLVPVPKGEVLFLQTDPADVVYIVRRGHIDLLLDTADGRELVIGEMQPGDIIGELSILTGESRSTTAIAGENSELVVLAGSAFSDALDTEPRLMRHILRDVAQRLRLSTERESALAFLDAPGRLARILLQIDCQSSDAGYMTISQDELAQRTGLTRQTVAKILGRWRRAGWLLTGRGRIVLLDRVALRRGADLTSLF